MPGRLSTHVLDTYHGSPAAGMVVALFSITGEHRKHLATATTNADGRVDAPLLTSETMRAGIYELTFQVGDYFRASGVELPEPAFLDIVPVRFGLAEVDTVYHVPLLVSPWAYSTYRGS